MASCRFTFPVIRDGNGDDDNNNNQPLDTTVISNNGSSSFTTKLALGITFGILGFLLISTAIGIFLFKIRKDVDPHKNPRWLPKLLKKPPSTTSSTEQQA
jgi:hypothetical protein